MIRYGRVVAVHPERRTVDLVDQDSGWPIAEAVVAAGTVSSDSGSWDVPDVAKPASASQGGAIPPSGRALVAAYVLDANRRALVLGFVLPNGSVLVPGEPNRDIKRHPSGAYTTIAPDGSMELYHPSGTYFRIGTGGHENLGAGLSPTSTAEPTVTLETPAFSLTVAPGGHATMTYTDLTLNGPVTLNGTLTSNEDVIASGKSLAHHEHQDSRGGTTTPPL